MTMPEGAFLPPRSLAAVLTHWMVSGLVVGVLAFGAVETIAGRVQSDDAITEEFGAETVIEFAPAIATMDARTSPAASDVSQPAQSAMPELKEVPSPPQAQNTPTEQAAEDEPEDPKLRMAQRETIQQTELSNDPRETTEAVAAREQVAASEAGATTMIAPDQRADQPSETATAPEYGNTREAVRRVAAWQRAIFAHLGRFRTYPEEARKRNLHGEALVYFTVDGSGVVGSIRIEKSSGHAMLDEAALSVLRRAGTLPAPPPEAGDGRIALLAPLRYQLK